MENNNLGYLLSTKEIGTLLSEHLQAKGKLTTGAQLNIKHIINPKGNYEGCYIEIVDTAKLKSIKNK